MMSDSAFNSDPLRDSLRVALESVLAPCPPKVSWHSGLFAKRSCDDGVAIVGATGQRRP